MPFFEEVIVIYAALNGYFDNFKKEDMKQKMRELIDFIRLEGKSLLSSLEKERDLTPEIENNLKKLLDLWQH